MRVWLVSLILLVLGFSLFLLYVMNLLEDRKTVFRCDLMSHSSSLFPFFLLSLCSSKYPACFIHSFVHVFYTLAICSTFLTSLYITLFLQLLPAPLPVSVFFSATSIYISASVTLPSCLRFRIIPSSHIRFRGVALCVNVGAVLLRLRSANGHRRYLIFGALLQRNETVITCK